MHLILPRICFSVDIGLSLIPHRKAHHCDGVGGQDLVRREDSKVSQICQEIDDRHQRHGDVNGPGIDNQL